MIYKKVANFPYPILNVFLNSYKNNKFILDIDLSEDDENYLFKPIYEINSFFIKSLIAEEKATMFLIIQSKDNKFFKFQPDQEYVPVLKKRISLSSGTLMQLFIQSTSEISFEDNNDLTTFYDEFKGELIVPPNSLLGYSNIVKFNGDIKRRYDLFEKKLDENLPSEIKVELGLETIIIHYKNPNFQFVQLQNKSFNNPYIYIGLRVALNQFIKNNAEEGDEYVDLRQLQVTDDLLDTKLHNLMTSKKVYEISVDNIDEVISRISDKIIEKYSNAIKELTHDEN